jgi:hypothetical protein
VTDLALDAQKSTIRIQTFAEGLFARLAHDIELTCRSISGTASGRTATIEIPLSGIEVAGVLKDGRVDEQILSASDRRDILDKMRRDVFHAGADARVRVEATLDEKGTARVKIVPPSGKSIDVTSRPDVEGTRVRGSVEISLSAIGSDVVKGPMNAFRVKDVVVVRFDVLFQPA